MITIHIGSWVVYTLWNEFEFQDIFRKRSCIVVAYTVVLHLKGKPIQNLRHVHPTILKIIKKNSENSTKYK